MDYTCKRNRLVPITNALNSLGVCRTSNNIWKRNTLGWLRLAFCSMLKESLSGASLYLISHFHLLKYILSLSKKSLVSLKKLTNLDSLFNFFYYIGISIYR